SDQGGLRNHYLGPRFSGNFDVQGEQITIIGSDGDYLPDVNPTNVGTVNIEYAADDWHPGIYRIKSEANEIHIAANYHISESDFYTLSEDNTTELLAEKFKRFQIIGQNDQSFQEIQTRIRSAGFGSEIWYWFILMAIILLMLELAISRWYKAESIS